MENKELNEYLIDYYRVELKDFSIDIMEFIVATYDNSGLSGVDIALKDIGMHKLTFFSMAWKFLVTGFYVFILKFKKKRK